MTVLSGERRRLPRSSVIITNDIKRRPPANRMGRRRRVEQASQDDAATNPATNKLRKDSVSSPPPPSPQSWSSSASLNSYEESNSSRVSFTSSRDSSADLQRASRKLFSPSSRSAITPSESSSSRTSSTSGATNNSLGDAQHRRKPDRTKRRHDRSPLKSRRPSRGHYRHRKNRLQKENYDSVSLGRTARHRRSVSKHGWSRHPEKTTRRRPSEYRARQLSVRGEETAVLPAVLVNWRTPTSRQYFSSPSDLPTPLEGERHSENRYSVLAVARPDGGVVEGLKGVRLGYSSRAKPAGGNRQRYASWEVMEEGRQRDAALEDGRKTRVSVAGNGHHGKTDSVPTVTKKTKIRRGRKFVRAVVKVQSFVRGFLTRRKVFKMAQARMELWRTCCAVAGSIINRFILEEMVPEIITCILAEGLDDIAKTVTKANERPVSAGNYILNEVLRSAVTDAANQAVEEEAERYMDVRFARSRRNPHLATVEDVITYTVRECRRAVVIDALKECTEDYMFRRRSMGLVSDMIEDEIRGWSSSIATHVYFSYTARVIFAGLAEEVFREEAEEVVSETMAPLQDRLVQIRREKDVAAVQSAAQRIIVRAMQLKHAARTIGQGGHLVLMSEINRKTLSLFLAGRFVAILRAAEVNRLQVSESPLLSLICRKLMNRAGRSALLEELARELDRDETELHRLELERIEEVDRERLGLRARAEISPQTTAAAAAVSPPVDPGSVGSTWT